ncbi:hypothetical protein FRB99_006428 [Tulasnella sp. 403]|nr:hypothetical protein FRB99_006428 [Tulasnella sp. 403]
MSPSDFGAFRSALSGEVVRPGEDGYDLGIRRWSDNVQQPAQFVVFPKTNEDVSAAVKFATANNIEISICGGGHSWSGTSSGTGLVIYLGKYMNIARADPYAKLLHVGGGALWAAVDEEGYKHGLATVAGTVNHTGVGGLALGGGVGWLSGRHGCVVDNIVQCTVVLASGEIVTANETTHPDLFWALRGGGSNFGVVTEFVFKAYPQRPSLFITRFAFPVDRYAEVAETIERWFQTAEDDEGAMLTCARRERNGWQPILGIMYLYNGSAEEGRAHAKAFYDLGPLKELPIDQLPYSQLNTLQNADLAHGGRKYVKGITTPKLTPSVLLALTDAIKDSVALQPDEFRDSGFFLEYYPKRNMLSVPQGSMAYANRTTNREGLSWVFHSDTSLDDLARTEARRWSSVLNAAVAKEVAEGTMEPLSAGAGYTNYEPDTSATRTAEIVFRGNYPRLQEVKRKYDPNKVFHKWFPVEPAVEA